MKEEIINYLKSEGIWDEVDMILVNEIVSLKNTITILKHSIKNDGVLLKRKGKQTTLNPVVNSLAKFEGLFLNACNALAIGEVARNKIELTAFVEPDDDF